MVSSADSVPTKSVVINGITPAIIDNMFIVNPPQEIRQEIEESAQVDQDSGLLDVDFLEFNELEQDALSDTEVNLEFSELDIDFLEADFFKRLARCHRRIRKDYSQTSRCTSNKRRRRFTKGSNSR